MRLTCPSCAAEYEIDAAAIGVRGRTVRCAACGAEWFQPPATPSPAEAAAAIEAAAARRRSEPTVIAPEPRRAPPPFRPPLVEAEPGEEIGYDDEAAGPPREAKPVRVEPARRPLPAEPEELAASLRFEDDEPRAGGAFLAGFATVAVIGLILIGVYAKATEIGELAPPLKAPLAAYSEAVDRARVVVAGLFGG